MDAPPSGSDDDDDDDDDDECTQKRFFILAHSQAIYSLGFCQKKHVPSTLHNGSVEEL